MNSFAAIIYSASILTIFIATIEIAKSVFKNIYNKENKVNPCENDEEEYKTKEFKSIFLATLIYAILLTISLSFLGDYIGFDLNNFLLKEVFTLENFTNQIKGSLYISILNSILYLGYILQLIKQIEILSLEEKNSTLILKENLYGPILEEFIYRGIIFNILKEANFTNFQCSLISSLMFGISHLRHFWDAHYTKSLFPSIIFQASFTTVFGMYASYSYVKTGTLFAPMILHIMCNTLQFPRFHYLNRKDITNNLKNVISIAYVIGIFSFLILIYIGIVH